MDLVVFLPGFASNSGCGDGAFCSVTGGVVHYDLCYFIILSIALHGLLRLREKKKLVRMSVLCIVIVHSCFVCVCLFGDIFVGALWRMSLSHSCV